MVRATPPRGLLRCILPALLLAGAADAARLHRCIDAEGNPLFSDQPCSAQGARRPEDPALPSPEDLARSAAELAERDARLGYCPAWSLESLQEELQASFDARDINRLAALYHWPGATRHSSTVVLDELEQLLSRRLSGMAVEEAELPLGWQPGDPEPPPRLRLELAGQSDFDVPLYARFSVLRHAGCLWIGPADYVAEVGPPESLLDSGRGG